MEAHLSQLQDIVRLTIRQELEWSERRLKRVVMSHDASDNPAELYGADGKIYYRKAGGAGAEIGTGDEGDARYVRKDAGAGDQNMRNDLRFIDYQVLEFLDNAGVPVSCGAIYGWNGVTAYDFIIESHNSGVLTLVSAAGYVKCSGDRLSDVGTPIASGDAVKVDASIHVPLAQLPLTSKGTVFAGNGAAAGVLAAGTNTHVLTLDSTAALGVKWAVGSGGAYLPLAGGAGSPMVGDLYMGEHNIMDVDSIHAHEKWAGTPIDYLTIKSQSGVKTAADFIISSDSSVTIAFYGDLSMNSQKVTGLGVGDASTNDAARMVNLDSYLPLTAGSGSPLTGDLHIDSSSPEIAFEHSSNMVMQLTYSSALDQVKLLAYNWGTPGKIPLVLSASEVSIDGGNLNMGGSHKVTGLAAPGAENDAVRVDSDIRVPMLQIPLTTKGYLLVGKTSTLAEALAVGANGQILTADSGETLGVKWTTPSVDSDTKISNCPSTPVSVECKADCNIDITVPSGKVVTFIRS